MIAMRIPAVASVAVLIGAGSATSTDAHEGHHHHHHEHHQHHHLPADEQYPADERYGLYPDGNGGVYHLKGDQIRHCRPDVSVDNPLVCSDWK